MAKDFWEWHKLKTKIEIQESKAFFHEGEIWLVAMGLNVGHEQDGKGERFLRPVVIFKKFNNNIFWGIPLTGMERSGIYYSPITMGAQKSYAILSQLRLLDRRRLFQKMGVASAEDFSNMEKKIVELLGSMQNPSLGGVLTTDFGPSEAEAIVHSIIPDRNTESRHPVPYNNHMLKIPTSIPEKGFYYHYKHDPTRAVNNYAYEVMGVGCHTEDDCRPEDANLVVYRPLYEIASVYQAGKLFDIRPLGMFMESVTKDGKTFPRFAKITDAAVIAELETVRGRMYG